VYRDIYTYYDGLWYNHNYNGKLLSVHELQKGRMHGKQVEFQDDGTVVLEKFVYHGAEESQSNRLTWSCHFKDDDLYGVGLLATQASFNTVVET